VWDKNKTYKLLELLESSPEQWTCTLKEYTDRQLKAKCMEAIAQVLEENRILSIKLHAQNGDKQ